MNNGFDILRYRAALNQHREVWLLNFRAEIESFDALDKIFPRWAALVPPLPAAKGRDAITPGPFLKIMQRQARDAFEALTEYQSARAWTALRSFVEAPLIMGKWLEDPQNAVIWLSRSSGKSARKDYQDAYSGDSLKPEAMQGGESIRLVHIRLGDDFLQTQSRYYTRPITFTPSRSKSPSDDADDPADHRAHLYAVLHLLWFVLRSVGRMLGPACGNRPELRIDLEKVERDFAAPVMALARENETHKNVLTRLGLWPHELLQTSRHG
ncbi:MAG: hypothetical protein KKC51_11110 [Verrucomicrobia bacterium]|nr:hypothetical protein [Verrucomicrobiota bacterium]